MNHSLDFGVTKDKPAVATDVHVVAMVMSQGIRNALLELGFKAQKVLGGDPRVRMNYLFSIKHTDSPTSDSAYLAARQLCAEESGFQGYIEQEVIAHDIRIDRGDKSSDVTSFPMTFIAESCPDNLIKRCDIHVTSRISDEVIHGRLAEAGFYHLILDKPGIGPSRISTLQFESARDGLNLWRELIEYLSVVAFCGAAKLEVTRGFERFGSYKLPPIVRIS